MRAVNLADPAPHQTLHEAETVSAGGDVATAPNRMRFHWSVTHYAPQARQSQLPFGATHPASRHFDRPHFHRRSVKQKKR